MKHDELENLLRRSAAAERARVRVDLVGPVRAAIGARRVRRGRRLHAAGVAASLAASAAIVLALLDGRAPSRPVRPPPSVAQSAREESPWSVRLQAWLAGAEAPLARELDGVLADSRGLYRSLSRRLPRPLAFGLDAAGR